LQPPITCVEGAAITARGLTTVILPGAGNVGTTAILPVAAEATAEQVSPAIEGAAITARGLTTVILPGAGKVGTTTILPVAAEAAAEQVLRAWRSWRRRGLWPASDGALTTCGQ